MRGVEVGDRICELSARVHATTSELVALAADFDNNHGWDGNGIRSCAHWLAINAGVDVWSGMEMVRVGPALRKLPLLAEAFASGATSNHNPSSDGWTTRVTCLSLSNESSPG